MISREVDEMPGVHPEHKLYGRLLSGDIVPCPEEDAVVWLWWDPALFEWHRRLDWLFSPPIASRGEGDLWGIDDAGTVILIENKCCRNGREADPFQDFVAVEKALQSGADPSGRSGPTVEMLRSVDALTSRWKELLGNDLCHKDPLKLRPDHERGGVLPYSDKRAALNAWKDMAWDADRRIRTSEYKSFIRRSLVRRKRLLASHHTSETVVYCGLQVSGANGQGRLSTSGEASRDALLELGCKDRMVRRLATVKVLEAGRVSIMFEDTPL